MHYSCRYGHTRGHDLDGTGICKAVHCAGNAGTRRVLSGKIFISFQTSISLVFLLKLEACYSRISTIFATWQTTFSWRSRTPFIVTMSLFPTRFKAGAIWIRCCYLCRGILQILCRRPARDRVQYWTAGIKVHCPSIVINGTAKSNTRRAI